MKGLGMDVNYTYSVFGAMMDMVIRGLEWDKESASCFVAPAPFGLAVRPSRPSAVVTAK